MFERSSGRFVERMSSFLTGFYASYEDLTSFILNIFQQGEHIMKCKELISDTMTCDICSIIVFETRIYQLVLKLLRYANLQKIYFLTLSRLLY